MLDVPTAKSRNARAASTESPTPGERGERGARVREGVSRGERGAGRISILTERGERRGRDRHPRVHGLEGLHDELTELGMVRQRRHARVLEEGCRQVVQALDELDRAACRPLAQGGVVDRVGVGRSRERCHECRDRVEVQLQRGGEKCRHDCRLAVHARRRSLAGGNELQVGAIHARERVVQAASGTAVLGVERGVLMERVLDRLPLRVVGEVIPDLAGLEGVRADLVVGGRLGACQPRRRVRNIPQVVLDRDIVWTRLVQQARVVAGRVWRDGRRILSCER